MWCSCGEDKQSFITKHHRCSYREIASRNLRRKFLFAFVNIWLARHLVDFEEDCENKKETLWRVMREVIRSKRNLFASNDHKYWTHMCSFILLLALQPSTFCYANKISNRRNNSIGPSVTKSRFVPTIAGRVVNAKSKSHRATICYRCRLPSECHCMIIDFLWKANFVRTPRWMPGVIEIDLFETKRIAFCPSISMDKGDRTESGGRLWMEHQFVVSVHRWALYHAMIRKIQFIYFCLHLHADLSGSCLDPINGIYTGVRSDVQQGVARPQVHNESENRSEGKPTIVLGALRNSRMPTSS